MFNAFEVLLFLHLLSIGCPVNFACICLSETRITDELLTDISITEYSFIHVNQHLPAGGVAVYISKKLYLVLSKNQLTLYHSKSLRLTIYTKQLYF